MASADPRAPVMANAGLPCASAVPPGRLVGPWNRPETPTWFREQRRGALTVGQQPIFGAVRVFCSQSEWKGFSTPFSP